MGRRTDIVSRRPCRGLVASDDLVINKVNRQRWPGISMVDPSGAIVTECVVVGLGLSFACKCQNHGAQVVMVICHEPKIITSSKMDGFMYV